MNVLRPLFLDGLRDELDGIAWMENGKQKDRKAGAFIDRISKIRVFESNMQTLIQFSDCPAA